MGYQFLHVYSFSQGGKHTVSGCLGEACRDEGYTSHIKEPAPPEWLVGSREGIEAAIQNFARAHKDSRGHKLRKDGQILRADVVSWPPDMTNADRERAEKDVLAWYRKRYGSAFRGALRHRDEKFRDRKLEGKTHEHLHVYLVPEPAQHFNDLHPGYKAKRAADQANRRAAKEERAELRERGNLAYRNAMAALQDEFYEEVGKTYRLGRYGPRRARITQRAQSVINQAHDEASEIVLMAAREAAAAKEEAARIKKELTVREASLKKREEAFNVGKDTTLKNWKLPEIYNTERIISGLLKKETIGFRHSYFDRVYAWAAGLVQRVSQVIKDYTVKKQELDRELETQKKITDEKDRELDRLQGKYGNAKEFAEWQAEKNRRKAEKRRYWSDPGPGMGFYE
jgi:hypothetical protein